MLPRHVGAFSRLPLIASHQPPSVRLKMVKRLEDLGFREQKAGSTDNAGRMVESDPNRCGGNKAPPPPPSIRALNGGGANVRQTRHPAVNRRRASLQGAQDASVQPWRPPMQTRRWKSSLRSLAHSAYTHTGKGARPLGTPPFEGRALVGESAPQ